MNSGFYRQVAALALIAISVFAAFPTLSSDTAKPPSGLKLGARVDAAPLSSRQSGRWTGYTIDLCRRIFDRYQREYARLYEAADSGASVAIRQPDFIETSPVERIDALEKGRIDMMCGATTVTISRMRRVDFTLLTFVSGAGIMKKAGTDVSLLGSAGRKKRRNPIVVYVGCTDQMEYEDCTTTENWISSRFGSAIVPLPKENHIKAFEALREDEADFYVADRVILANRLDSLEAPDNFVLAPAFLTFEPYAIALAKGNDLLLNTANSVIAELYRNAANKGGINEIYDNYFKLEKGEMLKMMYRLQALPD